MTFMKRTRIFIGCVTAIAFVVIFAFQLIHRKKDRGDAISSAFFAAGAVTPQAKELGTNTKAKSTPKNNGSSMIETQAISTVDAVLKRLPPTPLESELPMDADESIRKDFAKRHGYHLLVRVLALQRVRDICNREDAIRKTAESLWEGMALPQLIQQMGEPHGVTTGDDPREIDPATRARARKPEPGVVPYRNGFVLSWERKSTTPFSSLKLAGHQIEFLYSSHPSATQDQPFPSPSYKVLYLTIDERGILTKKEWIECCGGMD